MYVALMHGCYCTGGGLRVYDISIRAGIFKHSIYYALSFLDLNFEIFLYGLEFFDIEQYITYLIWFSTLMCDILCIISFRSQL
jgi:hypothetical protein